MNYFAPDEEQVSKYLGIPLPEPVVEETKDEENFVGHRKIKLASPASSESEGEEAEPDVVVFTKNHGDGTIKLKSKSGKSLKRQSTTTIEDLLMIANQESIVDDDQQPKLNEDVAKEEEQSGDEKEQ